jgi:hypothetical protein
MAVTINGGGNLITQVVQGSTTTQANMGGTTYADTNLTASITPTSSSSKILVLINQYFTFRTATTAERQAFYRIMRDSTELVTNIYNKYQTNNSNEDREGKVAVFSYLDSPNTTSSVTYKTQHKLNLSAADLYAQHDGTTSFITLLEIVG